MLRRLKNELPWPTHRHGEVCHQALLVRDQRQSVHVATPETTNENAAEHLHTHVTKLELVMTEKL